MGVRVLATQEVGHGVEGALALCRRDSSAARGKFKGASQEVTCVLANNATTIHQTRYMLSYCLRIPHVVSVMKVIHTGGRGAAGIASNGSSHCQTKWPLRASKDQVVLMHTGCVDVSADRRLAGNMVIGRIPLMMKAGSSEPLR